MRSALFLAAGMLIGAGAATATAERPPRDIVSLNHVAIAVPAADFDATSAFYSDVMGFPRAFAFREADGSPYLSYLQINRNTFVEVMAVTPQRPAGFVHFGLEVDNVDAVVARLRARGVKVGDASVSARTKSKIAVAHTPDGTTIELMEFGPDSLHRKVITDWR
jgi:catechol 2,3-dioxygenase-like lactoylglutathione lyase family enzyme